MDGWSNGEGQEARNKNANNANKTKTQLTRISHRLGHNRNFDEAARLQPDEVV